MHTIAHFSGTITESTTCLIFTEFDRSILCLLPVWRGGTARAAAWWCSVALLTQYRKIKLYSTLSWAWTYQTNPQNKKMQVFWGMCCVTRWVIPEVSKYRMPSSSTLSLLGVLNPWKMKAWSFFETWGTTHPVTSFPRRPNHQKCQCESLKSHNHKICSVFQIVISQKPQFVMKLTKLSTHYLKSGLADFD